MRHASLFAVLPVMLATPAVAQDAPMGAVAKSSVGQAGTRQTREQAVQLIGQTGRVDLRLESRIQSRIRNRIDRNYAPQDGNAASIVAAGERLRTTPRQRRR